MFRSWYQLAALLAVISWTPSVAAQEPAAPLTDLEVPEGPVVNSTRVMAIGGAYAGIAEGADGHLYNPASFAVRYDYTRNDLIDWDWTLYWLNLPGRQNPDLHGDAGDVDATSWAGLGIDMKIAGFGFGAHAFGHSYALPLSVIADGVEVTRHMEASTVTAGAGIAYALHTLDLVMGSYVYGSTTSLGYVDGEPVMELAGAGSRLGLLWVPDRFPLRLGAVYRTPFRASRLQLTPPPELDGFQPDGVVTPAQGTFGASYMFWERKYNPRSSWGMGALASQAEQNSGKRRYLLFAYDIVITEATGARQVAVTASSSRAAETLSMRSFLEGRRELVGAKGTVGYRAGAESEVIANWLILRAGYYFEPSRVLGRRGRHHATGGFAFRIPFWMYDLKGKFGIDVARQYTNVGVGLGFWH